MNGLVSAEVEAAVVSADRHLDQRQVARHRRHVAQILDFENVDELVQVGHDAVNVHLIAVKNDGHARHAGNVGPADGQRLDVEGAAPKDQRDAVQNARLVFD